MKKFLLSAIGALALVGSANAVNHFGSNTQWTVKSTPDLVDPTSSFITRYVLEGPYGEENPEILTLYYHSGRFGKEYYTAGTWGRIRTEGDKVYFAEPSDYLHPSEPEWFLMYDFGLEVGEGTYVYSAIGNKVDSKMVERTYVRRIEQPELFKGEVDENYIYLEEFKSEECNPEERGGIGWWIPGIGGAWGPQYNTGFNIDGIFNQVCEVATGPVSNPENIVYSNWEKMEIKDAGLFRPGTVWTEQVYPGCTSDYKNYKDYEHLVKYFIKSETEIDGEKVLPLYVGKELDTSKASHRGYFKVEGHKVYFRSPDDNQPEWYLYYDFGLRPGEGALIASLQHVYDFHSYSYIRCIDRKPDTLNPDIEVMIVEEYSYSEEAEECGLYEGIGYIYSGIGGFDGLYYGNTHFEWIGGGGNKIREVTSDGVVKYEDWEGFTKVRGLESASAESNIRIEGDLISLASGGAPIDIYTADGRKIGSLSPTAPSLRLPSRGLYIITSPDSSRKIFVP